MLQGASVVRFANTMLEPYKKEKNFVFVAIFINSNGVVECYLLYQNVKKDPNVVYRICREFKLEGASDRLIFALELYNLSSAVHANEVDTRAEVEKLSVIVNQFSVQNNLSVFNCRSKRPNDGGAEKKLEDSGYEVVPDVLETDRGTWELIDIEGINHFSLTSHSLLSCSRHLTFA
ncbi:hypothetical protein EI94DRAFT_473523 [Lactarius quietus]|nr:hypothetical protein EI94DRAFT_473523 [Lactarius quietus]